MTSSANDEWNYDALQDGLNYSSAELAYLKRRGDIELIGQKNIQHTIDFIEYNMREMEIRPMTNNGD